MSTQILTELPRIQFTGMDYETVLSEMKTIIKNNPKWKDSWEEFYSSEGGMVFLQLMSWICDNLAIRQDTIYNELFLTTAEKKSSKIRLLKTIGYKPALANAARVPVKLSFETVQTKKNIVIPILNNNNSNLLSIRKNSIPKLQGRDIDGETTYWEILPVKNGSPDYIGEIILKEGSSEYSKDSINSEIMAFQGETRQKEMETATSDGPFIDLTDKNIAADSIKVYKKENNNIIECKEVTSFVSNEAIDKNYNTPYLIEYNDNGTLKIRFAPKGVLKKERLLAAGSKIVVFYRVTNGAKGNIPPGFLNTVLKVEDEDNNKNNCLVYNDSLAFGGTNNEELENAVLNAPLTLRTLDRAVTPEDFDILINTKTDVLKSKTYTASNMPEDFKWYYGRYINPQEAFVFLLLNKPFKDIPKKEYNNFPWVDLREKSRLNEVYSFGNGNNNVPVTIKNTYYGLTVATSLDNILFKNATILDLGREFNEKIQENINNTDFKLKISKTADLNKVYNDIRFSLLDENSPKELTLKDGGNILKSEDNARFITKESYNIEKPIDVSNARYIIVSLDDRATVKIDLYQDRKDVNSKEPYYLKWDNVVEEPQDLGSTKSAADFRRGIVQLINDQFVALSNEPDAVNANIADLYTSKSSYQYITLDNKKESDIMFSFNTGEKEKYFSITINDTNFCFIFNGLENTNVSYLQFVDDMNKIFANPTDGRVFVIKNNEKEVLTNENIAFLKKLKIIKTDTDDLNGINIIFKLSNKETIKLTEENSVIADYEIKSLIKQIYFGNEALYDLIPYNEVLGKNLPNADYNAVATMLQDPYDKEKKYFCMKSPTIGEPSEIFFEKTAADEGGNFMEEILDLKFNETTNESKKVNGIKKVYLMKNSYINAIDDEEKQIEEELDIGTIIFQNSCIYNNYDFSKLYSSYIFSNNSEITIGSNYNNFYYTGDEELDNKLKDKVINISGAIFDNKNEFDEARSNIEVKMTKRPVTTNAFYSIKTDLDIIEKDRINISLGEIKTKLNGILSFSLDEIESAEQAWEIELTNVENAELLKEKIINEIKEKKFINDKNVNILEKFSKNVNGIICPFFANSNRLVINGLSKKNSKLTFYFKEKGYVEDTINELYKNLLGTNKTNYELYSKYPPNSINTNNIFIIGDNGIVNADSSTVFDGKEYFYAPTKDQNLVFNYRKIVNGNSREPDYYIDVIKSSTEDSNIYKIVKTENSRFPGDKFYLHFINNRRVDESNNKQVPYKDEQNLDIYMNNKKISGMEITWMQPYISTYDIKAMVYYNTNYSEGYIKNQVEEKINNLCSIENADIGGKITGPMIIHEVMKCSGVRDIRLEYLGYNYSYASENLKDIGIQSPFYGISCLADYEADKHGLMITYNSEI